MLSAVNVFLVSKKSLSCTTHVWGMRACLRAYVNKCVVFSFSVSLLFAFLLHNLRLEMKCKQK